MAKRKFEGCIEFGNWRLVPMDALNWELYHRHASVHHAHKGVVGWYSCGRYYNENTIGSAVKYAADYDLKEGIGETVTLAEAMDEHMRIVRMLTDAVSASLTRR